MKITSAIPILTFVGFLNFECDASPDLAMVQMSDERWFSGSVHHNPLVPAWMGPRTNPADFPGYTVFIRLNAHPEYLRRSDLLKPIWTVLHNRDAAAHPPRHVKLWLDYNQYVNKEPFVLYNPAITPIWNCDRMFITIPGTTLVYETVIEMTKNVTSPFLATGTKRLSITPQETSTPHITPPSTSTSSSSSKPPRVE